MPYEIIDNYYFDSEQFDTLKEVAERIKELWFEYPEIRIVHVYDNDRLIMRIENPWVCIDMTTGQLFM